MCRCALQTRWTCWATPRVPATASRWRRPTAVCRAPPAPRARAEHRPSPPTQPGEPPRRAPPLSPDATR
ncbi:hypothetical protein RR46_04002 [Papilio xuthus]|uniref:Uncharacterized protein n=1 Tax=Papilio xuthus TaxID=66420 RepID=A0A194QJS4_PAPXU|nr:hypothetical protein RR46_04002 [Papilio xuthus]